MDDTMFKTTGSDLLLPVSELLGFPLDQVNFIACQLFALAVAFWFRLYLSPTHFKPLARHAVATVLGIIILIFCFGWYSTHILAIVVASYLIILRGNMNNVHRYTMVAAMGYLTACQVSRVFIYNYGVLSTDFSGPLMMVTQKVTTLAFQLHDGMCKKSKQLTTEQKPMAVSRKPSLIEYLSYNLNFLGILVGPCNDYKDYIEFIEGRHIQLRLKQQHHGTRNGLNGYVEPPNVSPLGAVCRKLVVCIGCMLLFLIVTRSLPIRYNVDVEFLERADFPTRLTYAFFSIQAARPKFYFAWTLADAVNNAAGFGFQGIDESGNPSWDLLSNINIFGIETATSFKTFIDNWNIRTGVWLKTVCYDRAPKHRLALTFVLSALWHGVYPGYYFTFLTAIPITMAARAIRRSVRHHFLSPSGLKLAYDFVTWAATQLTICYTVMPFLLLSVDETFLYYRSMYFHVHILSIVAVVVLHGKRKPKDPCVATKSVPPDTSLSSFVPSCSDESQPIHCNNNDKEE